MGKIEIDVDKTKSGLYSLEIDGERLLATVSLGEIMDRIEKELKKILRLKTGNLVRLGGFSGDDNPTTNNRRRRFYSFTGRVTKL